MPVIRICRRQAVEQMARHDSVPVQGSEVLNLAKERSLADEPAVVKRFSQRVPGVARRHPAVQSVEPLDCLLGQQAGGARV